MSYTWSISNYFDTGKIFKRLQQAKIKTQYYYTETLQSFNNDNSRSLKIPAFGIKINYQIDDPFRFFKVIKLTSLETSADGMRYGEVLYRVINFQLMCA